MKPDKTLTEQITRSVGGEARLLGVYRLNRPGYYFDPGVLSGMTEDLPAYREGVCGPIALLFRVRDVDEAIRMAKDSEFRPGRASGPQSERDPFIAELEAGMVLVTAMVASDPRVPFGG